MNGSQKTKNKKHHFKKNMKKRKNNLPQCNYLDENGKRCRRRSGIKEKLFLDVEIYESPGWVEVNLCPQHFTQLGGDFNKKR